MLNCLQKVVVQYSFFFYYKYTQSTCFSAVFFFYFFLNMKAHCLNSMKGIKYKSIDPQRVIKPNSWLHTGPPKNQAVYLRALFKGFSDRPGAVTTSRGACSCAWSLYRSCPQRYLAFQFHTCGVSVLCVFYRSVTLYKVVYMTCVNLDSKQKTLLMLNW